MSETRKSRLSSRKGERVLTPEIMISESEEKFLNSLYDFIEHEKRYLQCPEEGPDELRYIIYRSVFNKVIARSSSYKRVLLSIKAEYDAVIRAITKKEEEVRAARHTLVASSLKPRSLGTCQSRASSLKERVSGLRKESAELQQEIDKQNLLREQSIWIPGVTVAESEDPEVLDKHLERLESHRAALLAKKSRCVLLEIKTRLEAEQQARELWRDKVNTDNISLKLQYKRLRCVYDHLCTWNEEGQKVPLEELISSVLQNVRQTTVSDDDISSIDTELLESEEPIGVNESEYLVDYLDRFVELFDSCQYEEAALHAAHSPHGVLRNVQTINMFKGVTGPPGSPPPLLLFFHSLLMTTPVGDKLSECVSYEGVQCALQQGTWQLVTHGFSHDKLTYSEDLGDILSEHAQKNVSEADMLLALATINYKACGLHRKMALSMCKRGLIHSAVEFMKTCEGLTTEDYMWILCHSLNLCLLQLLTRPDRGQAAMLSLGVVCATLLADSQLQEIALQLLDSFVRKGRGVLETVMLEDSGSSVEHWSEIASVCSTLNRTDLTQDIITILLSQSGTGVLSLDPEGAHLTEHIFM